MMVAADDFVDGNVIARNVEHWLNAIVSTIASESSDLMPNVKWDSMPSACNLMVIQFAAMIKIENRKMVI